MGPGWDDVSSIRLTNHRSIVATRFPHARRLWQVAFCVAIVALVAYFLMPPAVQDVAYEAFGLAGVLAVLGGVVLHRPERRKAWLAIALGIGLEVGGDAIFTVLDASGPVSVPSVADAFYLAGPILLAIGFALLANRQGLGLWRPALLDATLVATAIGVVAWELVIGSAVHGSDLIPALITVAYPVLDLVLLGVLTRHVLGGGRPSPTIALLMVGFGSWLIADFAYITTSLSGAYESGTVFDAGWLLGYILIGVAALHPSMRNVPAVEDVDHLSRGRIILVGGAVLVPVVGLALQPLDGPEDVLVGVLGSALVVVLVVARLIGSLARTQGLLAESHELRAKLAIEATTDPLTGLPNRAAFATAASRALALDTRVGLLFLDLDAFKRVNDTWGHDTGDLLLCSVAQRLSSVVQAPALLARLGGDEFAVLVPDVPGDEAARAVAERMLSSLGDDVQLGELRLRVRARIGVATGSGVAWSTLARDADVAMYEAKRSGGGSIEVHRSAHEQVVSAYRLSQELDRAIDGDELRVWYQPIFDLEAGTCVGAEALVRWQHPTQGLLGPASFIPLAESTGDVRRVDAWVLATAARQVSTWKAGGIWPTSGTLHVNLSPRRLTVHPLIDTIEAALDAAALRPEELTIELTETADLSLATTAEVVDALHSLGVALALDDFGTHYAVLASLATLPFDVVKIDRSLVPAGDSPAGARLLEGIVSLAHGLGVVPVAEGIETDAQLALLRDLGCRLGQGYLLARPCPATAFAKAIEHPPSVLAATAVRPRAARGLSIPSRTGGWHQPDAARPDHQGAVA